MYGTCSLKLKADKGQCYLEPVLIDKSRLGKSSINQLSEAAYALILQCAVRQSTGGIATGIGTSQAPRSRPHTECMEQKLQIEREL